MTIATEYHYSADAVEAARRARRTEKARMKHLLQQARQQYARQQRPARCPATVAEMRRALAAFDAVQAAVHPHGKQRRTAS